MRSGSNASTRLDGTSPLEMVLDQAIAQHFASTQERPINKRRNSPAPMSTALALTSKNTDLAVVTARLSWRGIEVSEEFQDYAARVSRGEQLAPYRGAVLSRPCAEFPWGSPPATSTTVPTPTLAEYPGRGSSLKNALWVSAAVVSLVAALGLGKDASSLEAGSNAGASDARATAVQNPTAATALGSPSELASTAPETALASEIPVAEPATALDAAENAKARVDNQAPAAVRRRAARLPDFLRPPEARTNSGASSIRSSVSATLLSGAAGSTRAGGLTGAARSAPIGLESSARDSSLFSDKPPF